MPKQSPAVYRRRRVAALIAVVVVIAVVWGLVAGISGLMGGKNDDAASVPAPSTTTASVGSKGSATASPSSSAKPSPTGSAAEVPLCSDDVVQVTVSTDKQSYGPKDKPVLIMTVTNNNTVACAVNVGTSVMEYKVMLGNAQVFSTKDCQVGGETLYKLIQPGKSETARFTWGRNATAPKCAATTQKIDPGNYQVTAVLGNVFSAPATFELTWQ
jgi:hypothetical protein